MKGCTDKDCIFTFINFQNVYFHGIAHSAMNEPMLGSGPVTKGHVLSQLLDLKMSTISDEVHMLRLNQEIHRLFAISSINMNQNAILLKHLVKSLFSVEQWKSYCTFHTTPTSRLTLH